MSKKPLTDAEIGDYIPMTYEDLVAHYEPRR